MGIIRVWGAPKSFTASLRRILTNNGEYSSLAGLLHTSHKKVPLKICIYPRRIFPRLRYYFNQQNPAYWVWKVRGCQLFATSCISQSTHCSTAHGTLTPRMKRGYLLEIAISIFVFIVDLVHSFFSYNFRTFVFLSVGMTRWYR